MAPTPASKPTPSSKSNTSHHQSKTPQSKHRLNFGKETTTSPQSKHRLNFGKETTTSPAPPDHPVEVIGRIRDHPEQNTKSNVNPSALQINSDGKSLRVKTEIGYRDFSFDGVSLSEEDDLDGFYKKFVESRINGVKLGNKCTIMMYGPTGSGKSHTMFGCSKQPGIVYKSLKDILSEEVEENGEKSGGGTFVQVTVLEIYNEEIYDLLSSGHTGGGFSFGWSKGGSASKVRLEVMGKKAKNATFISGNEAGKILREIQKVEKRRIVKSTLCNERSSRSHCMIILDVPTVGGRLMLVDMAGSENIEQAGQNGFEAKMQTAKINQGNIALKRVVESIANGDSHVPFRDSKLTMLLQDSFEDNNSKILMILCASPDAKELHKTIATLEYGAKAKCIVRGPHTPTKGADESSSAVILGSRIAALDQFICKLQIENKLREKERNDSQRELKRKEEEISALRTKLAVVEGRGVEASEEEINCKVNERTQMLKSELEKKIEECQKMANEFVEMERRKMEQRMSQQQQEVEFLKWRLEDIECELRQSRVGSVSADPEDSSFMKRLMEVCSEDSDMVKSMDLSKSIDFETSAVHKAEIRGINTMSGYPYTNNFNEGIQSVAKKACLTTVYEEEEDELEEKNKGNPLDEEVQKEVIEEKKMIVTPEISTQIPEKIDYFNDAKELGESELYNEPENVKDDTATSRQTRIQNIFTLCGNYRELSQHNSSTPMPCRKRVDDSVARMLDDESSQLPNNVSKDLLVSDKLEYSQNLGDHGPRNLVTVSAEISKALNENQKPSNESNSDVEVYVKWEALKENPGKFITTLKVSKESTLADLRELIEIHLGGGDQQPFTFLVLGDPSGAPVPKDKEAATPTSKLPICNNQLLGHLACLRPLKPIQKPTHLPFSPLENKLQTTSNLRSTKKGDDDCFSPKMAQNLNSTPFVTVGRY